MPLNLIFSQASRIISYGRGLMARVITTCAYAWARSIVVEAGIEVLDHALAFAVEWAARCVSSFS
jgi:hypothetical protein